MKRFHVHVAVSSLQDSIRFYSTLFGSDPTVRKDDYAKWMLEDPRVNFAISERVDALGVNHLGLQVDDASELDALLAQLREADAAMVEQRDATCCYARSDKVWVTDPQGVAWETFHTLASAPVYGDDGERGAHLADATERKSDGACCAPSTRSAEPACCVSC
jgi:catechol 2,3-dioxygenase-like lactoylglutathione lyase family enzyme